MGYYQYRMYIPFLRDCTCHPELNLVMEVCASAFPDDSWWIECDFCGNKTKIYYRLEDAEFKWNEFQFKRAST